MHLDGIAQSGIRFPLLLAEVSNGDTVAQLALFREIEARARFLFVRKVPFEFVADMVHDLFVTAVVQIRRGQVRQPECLPAYIRSIARRMIGQKLKEAVIQRRWVQPGQIALEDRRTRIEMQLTERQERRIMKDALHQLPDRDREILVRFYLLGQQREEICARMGLSETQFRLHKSRAKQRLGEFVMNLEGQIAKAGR